jgi:acyl-[acyl-carrier-protein] desaturase
MVGDRRGREVMARVAGDEQLHHVFYRDLTSAALAIDPSAMVLAIDKQVREFAMPGTGIPDFGSHAKAIANAGIYDFASHSEHILEPVVRRGWGLEALEGLSPEAEDARARVLRHMGKVAKVGRRMAARRAERQEVLAATG